MQTLIKTHKNNSTYNGNHFFVLSKGNNSGRPMNEPCPNCFVIITKSPREKQLLYWLCFGLWKCEYFQPFLTGSVIPFLRLSELKSIIQNTRIKIEERETEFDKAIDTLSKLENYKQNVLRQLQLIDQAKKSLMWKLLK